MHLWSNSAIEIRDGAQCNVGRGPAQLGANADFQVSNCLAGTRATCGERGSRKVQHTGDHHRALRRKELPMRNQETECQSLPGCSCDNARGWKRRHRRHGALCGFVRSFVRQKERCETHLLQRLHLDAEQLEESAPAQDAYSSDQVLPLDGGLRHQVGHCQSEAPYSEGILHVGLEPPRHLSWEQHGSATALREAVCALLEALLPQGVRLAIHRGEWR
mmetsp:Transcript_118863/g.296491  ORF Transcript_118863/g.296491 Transcript_118863/m.296491 type:complete len:218 (-) Transcript_118863:259-912(-)